MIERGGYRGKDNECVMSMYPFRGALYIGSGIQGGGVDRQNKVGPASPELFRLHPDGSWDLLVGQARETPQGRKHPLSGYLPGFDNGFNGYFWRMCEHDQWLYLSTFDWSCALIYADRQTWPKPFIHIVDHLGHRCILEHMAGFDLYRSRDGENWVPVTTNGMNNPFNMGLRTMASTPLGMFLGTANPFGPKILPVNGSHYIHNPRGGCEVFWAAKTKKHGELKSG